MSRIQADIEKPNILIVLSGPSGAGKSTICQEYVSKYSANLIVSSTTRKPRNGEVDGEDYNFVERSDFENGVAKGLYLEYAEVHNNFYGTPRGQVEDSLRSGRDTILEIDVQGGLQVKKQMPSAVLVFVRTKSFATLEKRLIGRGTDSDAVIDVRLQNARRELEEMEKYDYFLLNDDLQVAVNDFLNVINAEKCSIDRLLNS
jgi:guanylate kinase